MAGDQCLQIILSKENQRYAKLFAFLSPFVAWKVITFHHCWNHEPLLERLNFVDNFDIMKKIFDHSIFYFFILLSVLVKKCFWRRLSSYFRSLLPFTGVDFYAKSQCNHICRYGLVCVGNFICFTNNILESFAGRSRFLTAGPAFNPRWFIISPNSLVFGAIEPPILGIIPNSILLVSKLIGQTWIQTQNVDSLS